MWNESPALRNAQTVVGALLMTVFATGVLAQSAAPAVQAASGALSAVVTTNPYGMQALWEGSDLVTKAVLLMLLIMSMGSWYIMIVKVLEQSKMGRQARDAQAFWSAATVAEGTAALSQDSPYRYLADAAGTAVQKHHGLMGHIPINDWIAMAIQRAIDRVQSNTQNGLAFLATVGSTSPFVGLFGTVWGIYHALTAIGISGQASIDKVAGPVGEALIMTAIGLAVAVPAVLAYNRFSHDVDRIAIKLETFIEEFSNILQRSLGSSGSSSSASGH